MKKYLSLILFVALAFGQEALAQNQYTKAIKESLYNYQQALLVEDYQTAASHLHPGIVEKGGGRSLYADILQADGESYTKAGFKIMDFKTLEPQAPVMAGEEIHCIVAHELTILFGEKYFTGTEHLLAASMDQGDTWYFIDLKTFDAKSLKEFIPNYNESLTIPTNPSMEELK